MALDFGPAEMKVLMLFAFLTIVFVGGGSRLDALIMVLFGICAGIVGRDPVSGSPRFTFVFFAFENGFQLVPVLVGLFAMSEVLVQLFDRRPEDSSKDLPELRSSSVSLIELWRMRLTLVLSSLIGTFVGILPGIGSTDRKSTRLNSSH